MVEFFLQRSIASRGQGEREVRCVIKGIHTFQNRIISKYQRLDLRGGFVVLYHDGRFPLSECTPKPDTIDRYKAKKFRCEKKKKMQESAVSM
jgi:hypothetical protein